MFSINIFFTIFYFEIFMLFRLKLFIDVWCSNIEKFMILKQIYAKKYFIIQSPVIFFFSLFVHFHTQKRSKEKLYGFLIFVKFWMFFVNPSVWPHKKHYHQTFCIFYFTHFIAIVSLVIFFIRILSYIFIIFMQYLFVCFS